ncbi:MAG: hypothetical protein ACREK2_05405 [Gemmatimonadota bacterium]
MMNGSEHLDTQRVYDLLDGRLDAVAEGVAQAHLLRCDRCRQLERECAGVVDSLQWYGSETHEAPAGYWDTFWDRWSPSAEAPAVVRLPARRWTAFPLAPALAVAAALALLAGLWWVERPGETGIGEVQMAEAPPIHEAVAGSGWAEDYARFEQMTIAVGGIGPVSKGIALASLAEEP